MAWTVNTLREIDRMQREMDNLFNRFGVYRGDTSYPLINVYDEAENLVIKAEMPGMKRESLHITVNQDTLRISGRCEGMNYGEEVTMLRGERCCGGFEKVLDMPVKVQEDRITATMSDGVLTVTLPKAEEAKPKFINIE